MAEVILRIMFPVDTRHISILREPHPIYGWALRPEGKQVRFVEGEMVEVKYNKEGWRDVDHTLKKRSDISRILVLGDSFMEAYSVDFNKSFPKQLEIMAQRNNKTVETINMGVGGYGTLQEYLVYQTSGKAYQPDIVLLGFYLSNDVVNNSSELERMTKYGRTKRRPYLIYEKMPKWEISKIDYKGSIKRYNKKLKKLEKQPAYLGGWQTESALLEFSEGLIDKLRFYLMAKFDLLDHYYKKRKKSTTDKKNLLSLGVYYCETPPEYERAWQITVSILHKLKSAVESNGSKLVVFSVPARKEVDKHTMKQAIDMVESLGVDICLKDTPKAYDKLNQVMSDLKIDYINLLPKFKMANDQGIHLFYNKDRHWNANGHALASKEVYQFLEKIKAIKN